MNSPVLKSDAYRPCVGMMVINRQGLVLVGQRIDNTTEAWQMPQGGIDEGEETKLAALRELREEIGTDKVEILAETPDWLYYDLPEHLASRLWQGRYRGQKQKWFLVELLDESSVNIHTPHPEFRDVQWVEPHILPDMIVPFKKQLYQDVLAAFEPYLQHKK